MRDMNPNTQKRTCERCTAGKHPQMGCELGYEVGFLGGHAPNRFLMIPMQPCPKPLSHADFIFAREFYPARISHSKVVAP